MAAQNQLLTVVFLFFESWVLKITSCFRQFQNVIRKIRHHLLTIASIQSQEVWQPQRIASLGQEAVQW
jgi:hypothetical protein